ncbi:MAG TPA: hypothetical protein VF708_22410 [Pyrinomonadaceae bacterium]|jgi:hypothetical protein
MLLEQLEELTMAITGAQKIGYAYVQERRKPVMMSSMEITLEPGHAYTTGVRHSAAQWCPTCGKGFRMVSAFAATAMADITFRMLYRWAETGEVHFSATAEGALLICLDSLLERVCVLEAHTATGELMIA